LRRVDARWPEEGRGQTSVRGKVKGNKMKAFSRGALSLLVVGVLVAGGCSTDSQVRRLEARNMQLDQRNRELATELSDLKMQAVGHDAAMAEKDRDLLAKDRKIGELGDSVQMLRDELATAPAAAPPLSPELTQALERLKAGTLVKDIEGPRVRLEGDVLFASGKADIQAKAMSQLNALADVIKGRNEIFAVRVDGHTDSDPISKSKWADNWQLSCERARAVLKALVKAGVPEEKMFIAAYGMHNPRVPNDSAASKQKNRRVELLLMASKE